METQHIKKEERDALALRLVAEIDASRSALGSLPARWKRNKNLYDVVPGTTNLNVVDGMEAYTIPLWRQKCDRLVGSVVGAITGLSPYVQFLGEDDGKNEENLERAMQAIAERGKFDRVFKNVVKTAFNTNLGISRIVPKTDGGRVIGVDIKQIRPENFVCFPKHIGCLEDAKTYGHKFVETLYEVRKRIKDKVYFDEEVQGGYDPDSYDQQDTGNTSRAQLTQPDESPNYEDSFVNLYEVLTYAKLSKDDERKHYICTVAYDTSKLLSIQEWPEDYEPCPYIEHRTSEEDDQFWSNDSVAQTVQGIGLAFSDIWTTLIQGGFMTAFPPLIIGGALGSVKAKKYGPAQVWEVPGDKLNAQVLPIKMDGQALLVAAEKLEGLCDALTGISRLGTSENLPAATTATAAAGFLQGQQESKDNYTDSFSPSVEKAWRVMYGYLKAHFDDFKAAFGELIPIESYEEIADRQYRLEVTGKSGSSNPQVLLQKLQMAMQMAANPVSTLDYTKIEERVMQALDLPFDAAGLQKDAISQIVAMLQQMQAQMPQVDVVSLFTQFVAQLAGGTIGQTGPDQGALGEQGMGGLQAGDPGAQGPEGQGIGDSGQLGLSA